MKTHRDHFMVGFDCDELIARFNDFQKKEITAIIRDMRLHNTRDWNISNAKQKSKGKNPKQYIYEYLYRPFDERKILYDLDLIERGTNRYSTMRHFLAGENVGLIFPRIALNRFFDYGFCTEFIADVSIGGKNTGSETYVAPLYLYEEGEEGLLKKDKTKRLNFTGKFVEFIAKKYPQQPTPEEIFGYIYAILYCPTYREKYLEFLKIDFPRIPFVDDYEKFKKLSELGWELVQHHLMRRNYEKLLVTYPCQGNDVVDKVKAVADKDGKIRVWINTEQYFDGIPEDVWNFHIGGYQVLDKWLKERKGQKLSYEDIQTYKKIANILEFTIEQMKKIDGVVGKII